MLLEARGWRLESTAAGKPSWDVPGPQRLVAGADVSFDPKGAGRDRSSGEVSGTAVAPISGCRAHW